jgi:hypothetical protein
MTTPATPAEEARRLADFLIKDYELKVRYLTDHFARMWTRFNYVVGIESAIEAESSFLVMVACPRASSSSAPSSRRSGV